MTILIAILALAEFAFFFIYDLRLSKDNRSERHVIRLMSCTGGMVLILLEIALPCPVGLQELAVDLSMSTAILVLYPCSFEKPKASFVASTYLLASGALVSELPAPLTLSANGRFAHLSRCSSLSFAIFFTSPICGLRGSV